VSTTERPADPITFHSLRDGPGALRPGPAIVDTAAVHRGRLIVAMVDAVAARGYAATTIADVVALAKVSRRTFYEYFADKEECFLAAYEVASDLLLAAIAAAVDEEAPWEDRLLAGIDAYLEGVAGEPAVSRVFLVEVLGAGPRALARRRDIISRFAAQLREVVTIGTQDPGGVRVLSEEMSIAIVGAVNELVLVKVEQDRIPDIPDLRHAAAVLVRGVVTEGA